MTKTRPVRRISDQDRRIHAYITANPNSRRRDIADNLGLIPDTVAHRLRAFVASGYLAADGDHWTTTYHATAPLPAPKTGPPARCPDCNGTWQPTTLTIAGAAICDPCRAARDTLQHARDLGITTVRVVVRPLATRARMPHPADQAARVWVDTPDDIDFVLADTAIYRAEAEQTHGAVAA
jgi:hypothetical protein